MSERNEAAPHICNGTFTDWDGSRRTCGAPAYIGFGVRTKCVQRGCDCYDAGLWAEWVMLLPDHGDPQDELDFGLEFEDTVPNFILVDVFRDFCTSCHVPCDFKRFAIAGRLDALCDHCGAINTWTSNP